MHLSLSIFAELSRCMLIAPILQAFSHGRVYFMIAV